LAIKTRFDDLFRIAFDVFAYKITLIEKNKFYFASGDGVKGKRLVIEMLFLKMPK
jgi:hypothetical protein